MQNGAADNSTPIAEEMRCDWSVTWKQPGMAHSVVAAKNVPMPLSFYLISSTRQLPS
jgi:hypothetical protein